jgi:hypothetical protein
MALRIRNNKDINGFQIKIDEQTHSIKISQLADDTTLYFNSKNVYNHDHNKYLRTLLVCLSI